MSREEALAALTAQLAEAERVIEAVRARANYLDNKGRDLIRALLTPTDKDGSQ